MPDLSDEMKETYYAVNKCKMTPYDRLGGWQTGKREDISGKTCVEEELGE